MSNERPIEQEQLTGKVFMQNLAANHFLINNMAQATNIINASKPKTHSLAKHKRKKEENETEIKKCEEHQMKLITFICVLICA